MIGRMLGRSGAPAVGGTLQEGVAAYRTASGTEASFTDTSVSLPASAQPTFAEVSISAASALAQVQTRGARVAPRVVQAANPPIQIDLSMLPRGSAVVVSTEAAAAGTIGIVVHYKD
jgi:hypothetical protein